MIQTNGESVRLRPEESRGPISVSDLGVEASLKFCKSIAFVDQHPATWILSLSKGGNPFSRLLRYVGIFDDEGRRLQYGPKPVLVSNHLIPELITRLVLTRMSA